MTTPQFEEWSLIVSKLKDKTFDEQIKFEDYYAQIQRQLFFGLGRVNLETIHKIGGIIPPCPSSFC